MDWEDTKPYTYLNTVLVAVNPLRVGEATPRHATPHYATPRYAALRRRVVCLVRARTKATTLARAPAPLRSTNPWANHPAARRIRC